MLFGAELAGYNDGCSLVPGIAESDPGHWRWCSCRVQWAAAARCGGGLGGIEERADVARCHLTRNASRRSGLYVVKNLGLRYSRN